MTKGIAAALEHLSETELQALLDPETLPQHIAIIMDGNGRWAAQRGLPRMAGHTEGIKSVREMMTLCGELGIRSLTIYAFSQENWKRPVPEINALMMLLEWYLQMEMEALVEKGARFRAIGRVNSLPESALAWVKKVERETAHCDKLNLTVALSYGGRSEIVDAVRRLANDVRQGRIEPDAIDAGSTPLWYSFRASISWCGIFRHPYSLYLSASAFCWRNTSTIAFIFPVDGLPAWEWA